MTIVIVCAGGPKAEIMSFAPYREQDVVYIGADRGALHLLNEGIIPREAIGDFDSVNRTEYERIQTDVQKIDAFQAEKNETDTELAVERALAYKPKKVILTGVTGGRLDHMMSAVQLLLRFQEQNPAIHFTLRNKQNELSILFPGTHTLIKSEDFQYISFFPLKKRVENVFLTGFHYDIQQEQIEFGTTKFTSNELLNETGTISFSDGICLVVRSSDA